MKHQILVSITAAFLSGNALAQKPVNIVLINLDDAGNGDFSHKGAIGYQTPTIDSLAANGMSMTNFYAVQPISGASRAGLLTGCYPNRIGFAYAPNPNSPTGISDKEETIAELLKEGGYATAIFGKWHLGDARKFLPLQHGFDEYYGLPYSNDMWPHHPQYTFPNIPLIKGNEVVGYNTDQSCLTTDYTNHAVDFIRRNTEKPFFLYLAHSMPHVPLAVSDKFKEKSKQGLYGDVMMELDWSVGEVLKTIREIGVEENTLIIITSDNGPWANYGNHAGSSGGLREAKATTFNGGMRVPCIFYWKGHIAPASVCNNLMSNIDILPTLTDVAKVRKPHLPIDGLSMLPVLEATCKNMPIRKYLCSYYHENSLEGITDGSYKLIFPHKYVSYETNVPGNDGLPGELCNKEITSCELYDLRRDPGERINVIGLYPNVVKELEEEADRWREELGDDLRGNQGKSRREPGRNETLYALIPQPILMERKQEKPFMVNKQTEIHYTRNCSILRQKASLLADWIKERTGWNLPVKECSETTGNNTIIFRYNSEKKKEGFALTIKNKGILIESSDGAGSFYAAQILRQAMSLQDEKSISFPSISMEDYPEMSYRGAMLDVSRHFFSVSQVKRFIDMMALHRLNYFHWHLTDDQGWRVEIKKYPNLTKVGGWRGDGKSKYGGFYTQEEIKEIIAYATDRCITVIPEIDLPGHSSAALAAYPQLGCTGGPYKVTTALGGVHKDVLCVGAPFVNQFVKDVLSEVADLFPAPYIHIGGDEVPRDRWRACSYCQAAISSYGLKKRGERTPEDLLQGVFNVNVATYLRSLGKQMIGWDEVMSGDVTPETIIMSWRGLDRGMNAARKGHPVILSSNSHLYFNNYQTIDTESEPRATGGLVRMKAVYEAPLISNEITKLEQQKIWGAEACLWTSYVEDDKTIDYMMLPRMAAFSESVWRGKSKKTYGDFLERLPVLLNYYERLEYKYAPHFFEVEARYSQHNKSRQLNVTLASLPGTAIYYTLDGSEPSSRSAKYTSAIQVKSSCVLRAIAYLPNGLRSDILQKDINVNKATFSEVKLLTIPSDRYQGENGRVLVDGIRSAKFATTGLWVGYKTDDMEVVLDLGTMQQVKEVKVSSLTEMSAYIMGIAEIEILVLGKDGQYRQVAKKEYIAPAGKMEGKKAELLLLPFKETSSRFIKVIARRFKALPEDHSGAGELPFLFVDEIEVN